MKPLTIKIRLRTPKAFGIEYREEQPRRHYMPLQTAFAVIISSPLQKVQHLFQGTKDPRREAEAEGLELLESVGLKKAAPRFPESLSGREQQRVVIARAMALDRWLPSPLARVSKTTGVPGVSLLISCAVAALLSAISFGKLVVIDVLLYSAALSLEFAALIMLRWKRPGFPRPFRIPGGWVGVALVTIAPMLGAILLVVVSLSGDDADPKQALIVIVVIISGIGLYFARRKRVRTVAETRP